MATIQIRRGAAASLSAASAADGEPLFTTDTHLLYVAYSGTKYLIGGGGGSSGVASFNTRTGAVTLTSGDVTTALGFTPGGGTVTVFSSGNLSPLFTTSVATGTTTPALSFSLATQAANTFFRGPTSGSAAAPTFGAITVADLSFAGSANGVATLDSGGKVPTSQLPASVAGGLNYQGTWNASGNTPTLASGTGTKGYYYKVATAGSTSLDGITDWKVGDWVVYDGTAWDKIDNTESVSSVDGQVGAVFLSAVYAALSHTHSFSSLTSKPTSLAGYGITDAQPLDGDLTALAALTGTNTIYYRSAANTWAAVTIGSGLTFSGGALAATPAPYTITGTSQQIVVTNGSGVGGNPTISLPATTVISYELDSPRVYANVELTAGGKFFAAGYDVLAMSSDYHNYVGGSYNTFHLRISTDASRRLTGITGGTAGRIIAVSNTGSFPLVLANNDAGSSAGNRFDFTADVTVQPKQCVMLRYDDTAAAWRILAASDSTGLPTSAIGVTVQAYDADLAAIAALTTTGFLRRTGANTWSLVTAVDLTADVSGVMPAANMTPDDTIARSETAITTTATATVGVRHVCSGTSADYTVTVPTPVGNAGKRIWFRMSTALTKLVTLSAAAGAIDGSTTRIMWAGEACELISDGTNWSKVAGKTIPMACVVSLTADQSIPNNTVTTISWTTETSDAGDMHSTSSLPERVTPRRPGIYTLSLASRWAGSNAGTQRFVSISSPSGLAFRDRRTPVSESEATLAAYSPATSGTFATVDVFQDSGGALAFKASSSFSVTEVPTW